MGKDEDDKSREDDREKRAAHYKLVAEDVEAKNKADKRKKGEEGEKG